LLNSISSFFAILDSKRIGVGTWPVGVTWRHRSRNHWIPHRPLPIGGLWNQASISNGFRDIQWWIWRNGLRDLKRPL